MKGTPTFSFYAIVKRSMTLCCFTFILIFASCKKDGKPASELIVGKWNLTEQYYYIQVDGRTVTEPITTPAGSTYDFKTDGTVNVQMGAGAPVLYNYSFVSDNDILFTKTESPSLSLKVISINTGKVILHENLTSARMEFSK